MGQSNIKIAIQALDFDLNAEIKLLTSDRHDVGAVVSFCGLCRDEEGTLSALELEHYPGMAERQIQEIAERAATRWPLTGITAIHRFGKILPGENIVLVITASKHRQAAFDSANYLMDFLKTSAPFWKKEHLKNGDEGDWISAKDGDDDALGKWDR